MTRATLCCLMLACTAASSVLGADFPFVARVDVLPSIAVFDAVSPESTTETPTLTLHGLQDQCLDVLWLDEARNRTAPDPDAPSSAPLRLGADGRGRLEHDVGALSGAGTLQINLN